MNIENAKLIASILINIIDENNITQASDEPELWKLGYQEAIDMVIKVLEKERKNLL